MKTPSFVSALTPTELARLSKLTCRPGIRYPLRLIHHLQKAPKKVLAYAAEETERLSHRHLVTRHLLLGLLRGDKSLAQQILHESGFALAETRAEMAAQKLSETDPRQRGAVVGLDRLAALEPKMQVIADSQQELREKLRDSTAAVLELHEKLDRLLSDEL